jgi:DNA-binding LytR/AlgR family response regulator
MHNFKILIVEDDMITAADISMQLDQLGYEVSGITPRGEDALKSIEATRPDLILMDVNLKGNLDGVETARRIAETHDIPLIILTANADSTTFASAKATKPYAFISKPFQKTDLEHAIALAFERIRENEVDSSKSLVVKNIGEENYLMDDRIFVRHQDKMVKLFLHEVLYVEADRSYCKIYTDTKEYLLSVPLGHLEEKLPKRNFQRVHRSFVVNLEKIDAIGEQQEWLVLGNRNVPLSRNFRDELMARLRLI